VDKVKVFWEWFEQNHTRYSNFNETYEQKAEESVELLDAITKELKKFSEGLFVEVSATAEKKELIITAQGNREFFADAFTLVESAPSIGSWDFITLKPVLGLNFNFKMADVIINPDEILFMPLEAEEYPDDVAVRLYHKKYTTEEGATRNAVIVGLYAALNMFLGEKSSTLDLQYVDFDDMPHPKEQTFPFSELKDYIAYKKGKRANFGVEFPKEDIRLLEGKVENLPQLLVLNQSIQYYEFTEKFPYLLHMTLELKNVGVNGLPTGNIDEVYSVEDIVYKGIYKKEKGHFIATATHNGKRNIYYYADSKESIDSTLEHLNSKYETCNITTRVEFDPFWVQCEQYLAV
jgi:hypothetical protein